MEPEYIKELTETAARSRSNTKRLDALEKRQDNLEVLTQAVAVMQTKQDRIETDVGEIKADVKELKAAPGKRWEAIVAAVIGLAAGFAIKALLGLA